MITLIEYRGYRIRKYPRKICHVLDENDQLIGDESNERLAKMLIDELIAERQDIATTAPASARGDQL
jgi:hypothetical protein